jgi:hypothetical protein
MIYITVVVLRHSFGADITPEISKAWPEECDPFHSLPRREGLELVNLDIGTN